MGKKFLSQANQKGTERDLSAPLPLPKQEGRHMMKRPFHQSPSLNLHLYKIESTGPDAFKGEGTYLAPNCEVAAFLHCQGGVTQGHIRGRKILDNPEIPAHQLKEAEETIRNHYEAICQETIEDMSTIINHITALMAEAFLPADHTDRNRSQLNVWERLKNWMNHPVSLA
jgi:hypothetical protein